MSRLCQLLVASRKPWPPFSASNIALTAAFSSCCRIGSSSLSQYDIASPMQAKLTKRLMPLGGSITYGIGSSHGNGYREYLRDMLLTEEIELLFVGSRKSGIMTNNDHEGWRGNRLDQIANKARKSVGKLFPDIITVNAGSNDCIQDFENHGFGERMGTMLEYLWELRPLSTIILSTLLVNADQDVNSRILRINDQIRALTESMVGQGKRIVLADMYVSRGPQLVDLIDDGTHTNDEGYKKMAFIWFHAIQEAKQKGFFANSEG